MRSNSAVRRAASDDEVAPSNAVIERRRYIRPLVAWIVIVGVLHLAWEVAQLPLYTIWLHPDRGYRAFAVIHCLVGDILISGATYMVAAVALRDMSWSVAQPWRGGTIIVVLGVVFTVAIEWYNVYRVANWKYMPAMPLVFGIGLSPLLQWVFVPLGGLFLLHRWHRARSGA